MQRTARMLFAAAALMLSPAVVAADALDARLLRIAAWLSANFDLPAPRTLPRIERASGERMHALRYGGAPAHAGSESAHDDIEALYDDATRTIYLRPGWTGRTAAEVSVLVHELVHHLQNEAGLRYTCPEARERLAYEAQDRWLAGTGRRLMDEFRLDAMTVLFRTRCMH